MKAIILTFVFLSITAINASRLRKSSTANDWQKVFGPSRNGKSGKESIQIKEFQKFFNMVSSKEKNSIFIFNCCHSI